MTPLSLDKTLFTPLLQHLSLIAIGLYTTVLRLRLIIVLPLLLRPSNDQSNKHLGGPWNVIKYSNFSSTQHCQNFIKPKYLQTSNC